jgi:hypothetical protein
MWRPDPKGINCNCSGIEKRVSLETEQWLSDNLVVSREKVLEILDGEQGHWDHSLDTFTFVEIENLKSCKERWKNMKAVNL